MKQLIPTFILFTVATVGLQTVEVRAAGRYLYANPQSIKEFPGALTLEFAAPAPGRCVIAYGRRHRKNVQSRDNTTEAERELFKPIQAQMQENGKIAKFAHLPPDYYDLMVVDDDEMTLVEGIALLPNAPAESMQNQHEVLLAEIQECLFPDDDKFAGWEGFFDDKKISRLQTDGTEAVILLQQMRRKPALTGGGARIAGFIHSIDVCWLRRAARDRGWQVIARQQLYRKELPKDTWFRHEHQPALQNIRIGTRPKKISAAADPAHSK